MKLGIMQPYFFPYLGYFDLINRTDRWVVFDTPQYIYHGWVNRNRILRPNGGWQYVNVPTKKQFRNRTKICDVKIAEGVDWKRRILAQLSHYKKKAPYYRETIELLDESLDENESHIVPVNVRILKNVCRRLGITFDYTIFSEMDLDLEPLIEPGDWALRISELFGATEYLNPSSAQDLFSAEEFTANRITLTFQEFKPFIYDCKQWEFSTNLSIIDVLMWNPPEAILAYLNSGNPSP